MICLLVCEGNNIQHNHNVFLLSSKYTQKSHVCRMGVNKKTLRKSLSLYIIRSLPKHTWINDHDMYLAPNKEYIK